MTNPIRDAIAYPVGNYRPIRREIHEVAPDNTDPAHFVGRHEGDLWYQKPAKQWWILAGIWKPLGAGSSGGHNLRYVSVTTDEYDADPADDFISVSYARGDCRINLAGTTGPDPLRQGKVVYVKRSLATTTSSVIVNPPAGGHIDNLTSFKLLYPYQSNAFIFNGLNYEVF